MATTTSGSALSRDVSHQHSRAHVLHLIEACWRFCGFGRTLVVSADAGAAIRLRRLGLRVEHRAPAVASETAARDRARFEAIVLLDAAEVEAADFAAIVSMASRWVFVAGFDAHGRSAVDRASLAARCAAAGWVESTLGPLASETEAATGAVLCEPADRVTPRAVAEFLEWSAGFVRPNDHVLFLEPPPAAAIDFLWTHTEAARIGTLDSRDRTPAWLRQSSADTARRRFVDVVIVTEDAAGGLDRVRVSMVSPGGRLLVASSEDRTPRLPRELIDECAWPAARTPGTKFRSYMRTPLACGAEPYVETVFAISSEPPPAVVDFARSYDNPWLVHAMVIGRFRLRNDEALSTLARHVAETAPAASADAGGALCVLAYRALADQQPFDETLRRTLDAYLSHETANPHVWRWQISLRFVAALLDLAAGRFDAAESALGRCARTAFMRFAPHLGTKCTEAAFLAGWLAWQRRDLEAAEGHWRAGIAAQAALQQSPIDTLLIDPLCPASFEAGDGLRELTIAADHAQRCAQGLRAARHARTRGAARQDVIDRSLATSARALDEHLQRSNLVAADRLLQLQAENAAHTAATVERDRTQAGYALLTQSLREKVALLSEQLARETATTRVLTRAAATVRPPFATRRRLLIFGTGRAGQFAAEALSRHHEIVGFVDNDRARQGGTLFDRPVIGPAELGQQVFDAILIATIHAPEIGAQLEASGISDDRIYFVHEELSQLIVFGAGEAGRRVWDAMPRKQMIVAFADNAAAKQGTTLCDLPIVAASAIADRGYRYVVVASLYRDAIERQLAELGIPADRIVSVDASRPPVFTARPPRRASADEVGAFTGLLDPADLDRVHVFGRRCPSAALLEFDPATLAVGMALSAAGCAVTAFGAPAFVDTCEGLGLVASSDAIDGTRAADFSLLVAGRGGLSPLLTRALKPSQRIIAPRTGYDRPHADSPNLSFWYAPPPELLAQPID